MSTPKWSPVSRQRSLAAFTLMELLVVVAITAILATLIFGASKKAFYQAMQTKCASNLSTLSRAIFLFSVDHDGRIPSGWCAWNPNVWQKEVAPYVGTSTLSSRSIANTVFQCALVTQTDLNNAGTGSTSYSININLLGDQNSADIPPRKLQSIPNPPLTVLLADCFAGNTDRLSPITKSPKATVGTVAFRHTTKTPARPARITQDGITSYGDGKVNVSFCDGHIESLSPAEIASGGSNNIVWSP